MRPNPTYRTDDLEFWANVKLLSQRLGYHKNPTKKRPQGGFIIPTIPTVRNVFAKEGLKVDKLIDNNQWTPFGQLIVDYFQYRADTLTNDCLPNLLTAAQAKALFTAERAKLNPGCPLPMNKQKGAKKDFAFLSCLVNMHVEANIGIHQCDYNPMELTAYTQDGYPVRTLSRRVDGAFPDVINPVAVWEIKEYYYTTTFGSRIADGVYETLLDGYEVDEVNKSFGRNCQHVLFIDAKETWWDMGKSYLCRMVDMLHMGAVDEVVVGKEVVTRVPQLVQSWVAMIP